MSVILGLDPCFYLKKESCLSIEDLYIYSADLINKLDISKEENIKYLYNGHFDHSLPDDITNIIKVLENDPTYAIIAMSNSFEYFEKIYSISSSQDTCPCGFGDPTKSYILSLFEHLNNFYPHNIVISNITRSITINNNDFKFVEEIKNNSTLTTNDLPNINNYDNFMEHFSFFNWFYGRENKNFILSSNFLKQIKSLTDDKILNLIHSIFRGVYYPDYKISNGQLSCEYTIRAHSDTKIKYMKINEDNTTLIRIHCVPVTEMRGGPIRICYVEYTNYVFVFFYDEDHLETLRHEESIKNPEILRYNNNLQLEDVKFELKVKREKTKKRK